MQHKPQKALLRKILDHLKHNNQEVYEQFDSSKYTLYLTCVEGSSLYNPDLPSKLIEYFRGGYLSKSLILGLDDPIPTIEKFCIIHKVNFEKVDQWRKEYQEFDYACKMAELIGEELLQNEVLNAKNSTGALSILKAKFGEKGWKEEKEKKQTEFNIFLGNLGEISIGASNKNQGPVIDLKASPKAKEEIVDPKTIDRVVPLESDVKILSRNLKNNNKKTEKRKVSFMKNVASKKKEDLSRSLLEIDSKSDEVFGL
jgi:hypothetical protein